MNLLDILCTLDWISPVIQIGQEMGGMTTIDTTVDGWTGNESKRFLERQGVRVGKGMIVNGHVLHTVNDPKRAEAALNRVRGGR